MCCVLLDLRNGFSFLQLSRFPMRLSEWIQNNSPGQDQPQSECQIASPLQGVTPGLARSAGFGFCACVGTMNPLLTPPRRGTNRTRRVREWVEHLERITSQLGCSACAEADGPPVRLIFGTARAE